MRPERYFSNIQLSNSRYRNRLCLKGIKQPIIMGIGHRKQYGCMILTLTVQTRKRLRTPHKYWCSEPLLNLTDYSILFSAFTFFLNRSHMTFRDELKVCFEPTSLVQGIC